MKFDGRNHKLTFDLSKGCLNILSACSAACCSKWDEDLTIEEYASGKYEAEEVCSLDSRICRQHYSSCANRIFRMKKKADGACINLGEDNRCMIYENRPHVCRSFTCSPGWLLGGVDSVSSDIPTVDTVVEYKGKYSDSDIFTLNSSNSLKAVFAEGSELVFVIKAKAHCATIPIRIKSSSTFSEDQIFGLLEQVDGKRSFSEIFSSQKNVESKDAANELMGMMARAGLIIFCR